VVAWYCTVSRYVTHSWVHSGYWVEHSVCYIVDVVTLFVYTLQIYLNLGVNCCVTIVKLFIVSYYLGALYIVVHARPPATYPLLPAILLHYQHTCARTLPRTPASPIAHYSPLPHTRRARASHCYRRALGDVAYARS